MLDFALSPLWLILETAQGYPVSHQWGGLECRQLEVIGIAVPIHNESLLLAVEQGNESAIAEILGLPEDRIMDQGEALISLGKGLWLAIENSD